MFKHLGELFDAGGKALIGYVGLGKVLETAIGGQPFSISGLALGAFAVVLAIAGVGVYLRAESER